MSAATTPRLVTRAGIVIGGAYTPPPAPHSADAELMQGLLLNRIDETPDTHVLGAHGAMRYVGKVSERDIDRAILRNRTAYDRAECNADWFDDAELAAELAEIEAAGKAPMTLAAKVVAGVILACIAGVAVGIAWRLGH